VVWVADPVLPNGRPRLQSARDMARFSSSVLGGRLIHALSANMDFILVGRLLGSTALGFYSMAWDLLRFIPDRLYKVAGRVTLPAFCRLQDDNARLARAYREFFGYLCRIVIPIVACASIAAPELIGFIYGPKWVQVAVPMRLLAPGLILMGLRVGIGSIYYTKDHPAFDLYLHSARLALIIVVVSATAFAGLRAVSGGMSFVEGGISIAGQWMAGWLIGVSLLTLARDALPGLMLAAFCSAATFAGKFAAVGLDLHGAYALGLMMVLPGIVFLWREGHDVAGMVGKAFGPSSSTLTEEQA
jgi:PST family polysaccharide transporter